MIAKLLYIVVLIFPISAFALFGDCQDLFPNQQPPTTPTAGRDLCFDDFAIYYSPIEKKPIYAVEKLNREQILARHPKRKNQFYEEARLPSKERALLADYRGSGFDRGHNVPAGDMSNERSMAQSFSLANMMPQARQNNQGIWAKNVEEPTRQYAKRISGDLYVYTGSVGSLGKIGRSGVTVPSYLYKLIYDPEKQKAWAYWVENSDAAQMTPPISYAELMQRTGIDFHLPLENAHTSANSPKIKLPEKEESPPIPKVGGWYPVFFDGFSTDKVNDILAKIKAGSIASIEIQYDQNATLAKQLASQIESQAAFPVKLTQSSPTDSTSVQYERKRVVAIIHTQ